ncbi:MAG: ABC transporter permease, partial [Nitrosopumilaceae archaeon]
MSNGSLGEIRREFLKSKMGLAGIGILVVLVSISIAAAIIIPVETFQQWNNPQSWISYPKTSIPSWVNLVMFEKIPEHKILDDPYVSS